MHGAGFGSVVWTVVAKALCLLASAEAALAAIYWLDLGAVGFFVAVAFGVVACAAVTVDAVTKASDRIVEPAMERLPHHQSKGEPSHVPISPLYFAGR